MKFCRFLPIQKAGGRVHTPVYGLLDSDVVREIAGVPWGNWVEGHTIWELKNVRMLAPCEPSKVVCIGRNYAAHAAELGNEMPKEPLIFLEAALGHHRARRAHRPACLFESSGTRRRARRGDRKRCWQLSEGADSLGYVLGYTCLNDVTARDLQKADVQFTRAKGFDTFCPAGPYIETQLDPRDVTVECRVNGETRQSGSTALMAFPVAFLIRWISHIMTLLPGDLIATGTPAGVGPLVGNDTVEVMVSGIGVLRNPVHDAHTGIAR